MECTTTGLVRCLAFGLASASLCWSAPAIADCVCQAESVIGCGHRGTGQSTSGAPFPENTIPSFEQAVVEGADMVEFDVVHSADGVLVVIHDDTVDRTTDGSGCVGDLTLDELQALDAGDGTAWAGQGVTIPTLTEVLAAFDGDINIEFKINNVDQCPDSDKLAMAADVVTAIQGDTADRTIVVSSFDADVLSEVQQLDPAILTGLLTMTPGDAEIAQARGFDALNLLAITVDGADVADVHGRGLALNVWTENDAERMKELIGLGVDMIITDDPDVFAAVRAELCQAPTCDDAPPVGDDGGCAFGGPERDGSPGPWWLALTVPWLLIRRRAGAR
jgi:glycerophosphoryl diester phosphodiesterase